MNTKGFPTNATSRWHRMEEGGGSRSPLSGARAVLLLPGGRPLARRALPVPGPGLQLRLGVTAAVTDHDSNLGGTPSQLPAHARGHRGKAEGLFSG